MFKSAPEFVIRSEGGITIKELLAMVDAIRKEHPNAKIRVEVEV